MKILLNDNDLFGNEAAEDERQDVFDSYAYERQEVGLFCDDNRAIQIVRAYKGEGKSALMRIARARIESNSNGKELTIDTSGPALSPALTQDDFADWVRQWKASIVGLIASEVGAKIGMAWSDDAMALVELAEKNGLRQRNVVSAIMDRLRSTHVPIEKERQTPSDASRTLQRWGANAPVVWLFIDDIDRNFDGTAKDALRAAAFFEACRMIVRQVPSIRFRIAVRPNTWVTLKRRFEGMSHLEQYSCDLRWSEQDMLVLLAKRVEGYLQRRNQLANYTGDRGHEAFLGLAFESPVQWSGHTRSVHVPLDTLSLHRPRWLIELCRVSSQHAATRGADKIDLQQDVFKQLGAFGSRRLDDTVAEFKPQCPQIAEILDGFRARSEQYATADLLKLIENRILNHVPVQLPGASGQPQHRDVASFLFQIGFIYARRDFDDGSYEHIDYTRQPSLLASRSDMDSGCSWEIPPIFRQALNLRTSEGFERPVVPRAAAGLPDSGARNTAKRPRRIVPNRK